MSKKIAVSVKNLTKRYGRLVAVDRISFEIEEGDFFGFIGPNGAGKTTTIKSMLNLLVPNSGAIELFGRDVSHNEFQDKIGYVPGEANLYDNLTVGAQINYFARYFPSIDQNYLDHLKKTFQIDEKKKITELSLGNKKKIAIICALMNKPKLLVFDEVTNSLDPLMQRILFDELLKLNHDGTTIFFSSHNLDEVQAYCKNVAIIRAGKIIAIDNVEKVVRDMGVEIKLKTKDKINTKFLDEKKIAYKSTGENAIEFIYKDGIDGLIKEIGKQKIVSLRIADIKLEEIFSQFYRDGERRGK